VVVFKTSGSADQSARPHDNHFLGVLGLFKVEWAGERMTFDQLSAKFERAHCAGLADNTVKGHRAYLRNLKGFFGGARFRPNYG
jgi:hypothetical protein